MTALNATKRDLAEFVTVLSSDTKAAVSGASANINKILGQPPSSNQTGSGEGSPSLAGQKKGSAVEAPSAPYDRCQAQLFAVQNSKDTYLVDPEGGYISCSLSLASYPHPSISREIESGDHAYSTETGSHGM